jgi:hypothetical protein
LNHGGFGHVVVVLASEVRLHDDEIRYIDFSLQLLGLIEIDAGDVSELRRLAGEESHHD